MKNRFLLLLSAVILTMVQCSPLDADKYGIVYDTTFIKHTAMVRFIDIADPNVVFDNFDIEIAGKDAQYIVESGGTRKFRVVEGGIALGLDPSRKVTEADPVSFRIIASIPGYLPINEVVFMQEGAEEQIVELVMINADNPPSGIANEVTSAAIDNGVSNSTITLNINPAGTKAVGAAISIPSGVEFRDANGNKISGSQLEVSMTHFDPNGETSMNSFPGGFTPDTVLNENGEPEDGFFNTAGFASIDMSVGGTAVREFSQPIQVTMGIDPNTNNMDGNPVQLGDSIPIWSYEVETGQWQIERTGVVVDDGNGGMEMAFDVEHLSWYNVDYYGRRCSWRQRATVEITMPGFEGRANGSWVFGELVFASNNQPVSYWSSRRYFMYNGEVLNFINAPNAQVKFRVWDGNSRWNKGNLIAESAPFDACGSVGNVTVNLPPPTWIDFDIEAKCPGENATFLPNFYVWYREAGSNSWWQYLTYLHRGEGRTKELELGQRYEFRCWYNGTIHVFEGLVDKELYDDIIELGAADCEVIGR